MAESNLNPRVNQGARRVWMIVLSVGLHNLVLGLCRQVHQHYLILLAFWIAEGGWMPSLRNFNSHSGETVILVSGMTSAQACQVHTNTSTKFSDCLKTNK